MELNRTLLIALRECAEWAPHQSYTWKQASMRKLEALGLVAPDQLMYAGKVAYHVTEAGRSYLSAQVSQPGESVK